MGRQEGRDMRMRGEGKAWGGKRKDMRIRESVGHGEVKGEG